MESLNSLLPSYADRHIGLDEQSISKMLQTLSVNSVEQLLAESIPDSVLELRELKLEEGLTEYELSQLVKDYADKNQQWRCFIGRGYFNTLTPPPIKRHVMENPNWYTSYTPYQAEISQGRLEALINFQTMVTELTGLPITNASLLDDATAAAEALIMCSVATKKKLETCHVLLDEGCYLHVANVCRGRLRALGISFEFKKVTDWNQCDYQKADVCLVASPCEAGILPNLEKLSQDARLSETRVVVHADLLSLAILKTPGDFKVDVCVGSTQEFGIPKGYGGPYAAYLAAKEDYKRLIPGRMVGISKDALGSLAYRLTLQTREQHIRREKATSNICTAQALLASMAGFFAVYYGREGLRGFACKVNAFAEELANCLVQKGFKLTGEGFYRTVSVVVTDKKLVEIKKNAEACRVNLAYAANRVSVTFDIGSTSCDIEMLMNIFGTGDGEASPQSVKKLLDQKDLLRTDLFMSQSNFNKYRSETELMRYICRLGEKDYSLTTGMIPLGSCTMKLNAVSTLEPLQNPNISNLSPWVPRNQVKGYTEMIGDLNRILCEITGFEKISFQPNSGAQGEYAGLRTIAAFHHNSGNHLRKICLIPTSAHGTNPASARLAGMKVVSLACDGNGNICWDDFCSKLSKHRDELAALMVTYPSTHGVFEDQISKICRAVHENGGLVYMDGANLNAMVGLCRPARIGADVMHMNLHKTFAIPHGGGGPGMGPIGVVQKLASFLPQPNVYNSKQEDGFERCDPVSTAPYGSASILWITWAYLKLMGASGLKKSSQMAILSANYIALRLSKSYPILYSNENNRVAHECILDLREIKKTCGVQVMDVAKRLMDYGFHAPTVAFPVPGTLMIEPTESESLVEINRFCQAMESIRKEIIAIEQGEIAYAESPLALAPHPVTILAAQSWERKYSREQACFPAGVENKYWASVGRIDEAYGDRNLMCSCS